MYGKFSMCGLCVLRYACNFVKLGIRVIRYPTSIYVVLGLYVVKLRGYSGAKGGQSDHFHNFGQNPLNIDHILSFLYQPVLAS